MPNAGRIDFFGAMDFELMQLCSKNSLCSLYGIARPFNVEEAGTQYMHIHIVT